VKSFHHCVLQHFFPATLSFRAGQSLQKNRKPRGCAKFLCSMRLKFFSSLNDKIFEAISISIAAKS
jgi:hypothetical protein